MNEHLLSQIWQSQWLRREALRTSDGRIVRVVYRGRWSFGLGPDFQEALLVLDDGPLLRGDVELHVRAADWHAHGHDRDPRYDAVILHVTYDPAPADCRRPDGTPVPHLPLAPYLAAPPERFVPTAAAPLGALDDLPCAGPYFAGEPARLAAIVREAGYARLQVKAVQAEARFAEADPDQAFYADLLDALGYSHNRAPCRDLARRLPLAALDSYVYNLPAAPTRLRLAALLLGAAGFLPWRDPAGLRLSAATRSALEREWEVLGTPWRPPAQPPLAWDLARIRPANHPARRLLGLAVLLAAAGPANLAAVCLDALAHPDADPRALVASLTATLWPDAADDGAPITLIGRDRAHEIVVNVVIPHCLARASVGGAASLADQARRLAASLPAGAGNARTRAMQQQLGGTLRVRTALEEQGLLHLYTAWCASRRCYECPVAAAAISQHRA